MAETFIAQAGNPGRIEDGKFVLPVSVYWEDTDAGGIVYHANYLKFMERGRTELLRYAGIDQRQMQADGTTFVIRSVTLDYLLPALMEDRLEIWTWSERPRGASVRMIQAVNKKDQTGKIVELTRADFRVACVDGNGRAARFPKRILAGLDWLAGQILPPPDRLNLMAKHR